MSNSIVLDKGWWRQEQRPSSKEPIVIERPRRSYPLGTKMFTVKETARELGVSFWTVYKYIRSKDLNAVPKKKGYQIPASAIQDFRELMRVRRERGMG